MSIAVTWLGHSSVVVDIDGVRLVCDPLLRRHAGLLRRRGPRPRVSAWSGADAVLLSHLHLDHAEVGSLRMVGAVPVLTAPVNAAWAVRKGLDGRGLGDSEWFALGERGQVQVRLTPAVHHARPMPHRPNAANGHLVRGRSGVVWVAGDTELYDELDTLPALAGAPIDVAVVPVGGWGPRLSPGHLGPDEAAVACRRVGARSAVPVHWGTLHLPAGRSIPRGWMDTGGPRFAAALARQAPACRARVLDLGGALDLGAPGATAGPGP